MGAKQKAQIGFDDKVIEEPELEQLLEDRENAKAGVSAYRDLDKKVKAKIESMEEQPPYRIGRFIISKRPVEGHHVEFDTDTSTRVKIALVGEDG